MDVEKMTEIDKLVEACVNKGRLSGALEVAKLGASATEIDKLVEACVNEGLLSEALEAAKLREKPELTAAEIRALRKKL
jgi:hypothetical protein